MESVGTYVIASVKCCAAGDASKSGVWFALDHGDGDVEFIRSYDDASGFTLDEARAIVSRLEDGPCHLPNGEFGRPDYAIVSVEDGSWFGCDDATKYDWTRYDGADDDDDAQYAFAHDEDERHLRELRNGVLFVCLPRAERIGIPAGETPGADVAI